MSPLVIYHSRCHDGVCAAWVARLKFPHADFLPMNHGQQPPDVQGRDVIIADFSFARDVLERMKQEAASLVVLDHHKTAEKELAGLPYCVFDMERSGARITWDYLFPGVAPPWIVRYVEDRDLWRWALPHSRAVNAALEMLPWEDFRPWDETAQRDPEDLVHDGGVIQSFKERLMDNLMAHVQEVELDGHHIRIVNTPILHSETAGKLAAEGPFGATWYQKANGRYSYSLRGRDRDGVDVSEVAKKYGGGGHADAAGFDVAAPVHKLLSRDEALPPTSDSRSSGAGPDAAGGGEVPTA